jgi:hypothetical protein
MSCTNFQESLALNGHTLIENPASHFDLGGDSGHRVRIQAAKVLL